jgi:hypothetical protein
MFKAKWWHILSFSRTLISVMRVFIFLFMKIWGMRITVLMPVSSCNYILVCRIYIRFKLNILEDPHLSLVVINICLKQRTLVSLMRLFMVFVNQNFKRNWYIHILGLPAVVHTTLLFSGVSSRAELLETSRSRTATWRQWLVIQWTSVNNI